MKLGTFAMLPPQTWDAPSRGHDLKRKRLLEVVCHILGCPLTGA